ncbi:uncharacterized protein, partial [Engystomops pustulosus]|uniref:uncharacterized protein n=1 Tax=Engystomops pustulosus TaxID=76066 RepID=UPI003AFAC054
YLASAILTNVTSETSGLYRCTATNQLGSQTCDVDLHVRVGGLGPMGIFAAITITLIMGLVLLALFFLVLCLHQQSRGKWPGGEYRVDSVTYGQPHFAKSSSSDRTTSSRRPPHVLYCSTPDVPTMKRHWSPAPERMSSSSRHWSPAPEMMSSSSRHWSPAPERMSSSSRHWSPAPERMSSSSRHWSPAPERMSSSSSSEDSSTGNEEEGDSSPVVRSSIYLV